jgi:hypothetical protein
MGVDGLLPAWRKNRQTFGAAVAKSTGYSQTRGPKTMFVSREKVATGNSSDAKAPMTEMKRLRTQIGKIGSGRVKIKFMELRPSMRRWPIGDPKHIETFRFCGSACSPWAIYCKAHNAKAHAPNRLRTPRSTEFQVQPQVA